MNSAALLSLKDKVVWMAGGASKLTMYMIEALLESGASVVVASRHKQRNQEAAERLKQEGYILEVETLDVTDQESVRNCRDVIIGRYGRIDVLINAAALQYTDQFEKMSVEKWREALDVMLTGSFLTCQAVAQPMISRKSGNIINIGSMYGVVAADQGIYADSQLNSSVVYAAAKGGVISLSRYLACYLAPHNIRVNTLSPGGFHANQPETFVKNYCRRTPLGHMGYPDDIKGVIVFLASEASQYMTGQNLIIDGGWTAW